MKNKKIVPALLVILLIALVYVLFFRNEQKDEVVFCTQEALLCPGGNYVSRTGPMCQFEACEQVDSFVGFLEKIDEGFELVIDPNSMDIQDSYVLPLKMDFPNILGEFVGNRVKVQGSFLEGNIYAVEDVELISENPEDLIPDMGK